MRRHCLIAVSDKRGLVELGRTLVARGYEILSTGGTANVLASAGIRYLSVSDFTGFPEIFGGRVRTTHPRIYGGILGRPGEDDAVARATGVLWIDLVIVNLLPFIPEKSTDPTEEIDVGGPGLIRAAAKNHAHCTVVVDPSDYSLLLQENPDAERRKNLAAKAFHYLSAYDARVADWLSGESPQFPPSLNLPLLKVQDLRYGENPHQQAAFYRTPGEQGRSLADAKQLHGKELSFNNISDMNAAVRCVFELPEAGAVLIKHGSVSSASMHEDGLLPAYTLALSADPDSAYGAVLAFNRPVDTLVAEAIQSSRVFFELIAAPGFSREAITLLGKRRNLRLMELPSDWGLQKLAAPDVKRVQGGWLLQSWDGEGADDWRPLVRNPSEQEERALRFAWILCRNVRSNAIVIASVEGAGLVSNGIGSGQMSRLDAVRLALQKAKRPLSGSVLASDAFFAFTDAVKMALEGGISAMVQPGGGTRDAEIVAMMAEKGAAMVMTDIRHFRH